MRFEGYLVLAKRSALVEEIKRLVPRAVYPSPRGFSDLLEANAINPIYLLPKEADVAMHLQVG